jgi:hypothetical protein
MLINKFQCRREKAKGREEWERRNEGHWRCPFFRPCWEEGIKLPTVENCPECNGAYNLKGLALMTEDLQPRITVDLTINGSRFTISWGARLVSTIGWGARPAFTISWEAESMNS